MTAIDESVDAGEIAAKTSRPAESYVLRGGWNGIVWAVVEHCQRSRVQPK